MVIVNVVSLLQLNIVAAINITVAQMSGAQISRKEKQVVRSSAVCSEFVQQVVLVAGVFLFAPLIWDLPTEYSTVILVAAGLTVIQTAFINLFVGFHESNGSFARLGVVLPFNALLQLLVVWVGVSNFDLIGLFISMVLSTFLSLVLLLISLKFLSLGPIQLPTTVQSKDLMATGFHFRISDIGTSLFYMLDTLFASIVLMPIGLSLFITAKFCASLSSQALYALSRINLIRLGNNIGSGKDRWEISAEITGQFFLVYLILGPGLILISLPMFRFLIPALLPSYVESLNILPFFMIAILFSSRALFIRNIWIQSNQWKKILFSGVLALATSGPILFLGCHFFEPLDAVSLAKLVVVAQIPYALILIFTISKHSCSVDHARIRLLFFTLSTIGIVVSLHFNGSYTASIFSSFRPLFQSMAIGLVSFLPFFSVGFLGLLFFSRGQSRRYSR